MTPGNDLDNLRNLETPHASKAVVDDREAREKRRSALLEGADVEVGDVAVRARRVAARIE